MPGQKFVVLLKASGDRPAFRRWVLEQYAPGLVSAPDLTGLTVNLVDVTPNLGQPMSTAGAKPADDDTACDATLELWANGRPATLDKLLKDRTLADKANIVGAYRLSEHPKFDHQPVAKPGARTVGFKFQPLIQWRDDVSVADARRIWGEHISIVHAVHQYMSKYVQNWVEEEIVAGDVPRNGMAQIWYSNLADFEQRHYGNDQGLAIVRADTTRFIKGATPLFTSEYVLKRRPR